MSTTRAKSASKESVPQTSLWELARLFLKLGTIAFGGPAAHIAMMEDEVVRRRAGSPEKNFSISSGPRILSLVPTQPSWRSKSDTVKPDGPV